MAKNTKIIDEFTDMPISRQRKAQLRNRKAGKCQCGSPKLAQSASSCERCLVRMREWQFKNVKRRKRKTKGPTKQGAKRIV